MTFPLLIAIQIIEVRVRIPSGNVYAVARFRPGSCALTLRSDDCRAALLEIEDVLFTVSSFFHRHLFSLELRLGRLPCADVGAVGRGFGSGIPILFQQGRLHEVDLLPHCLCLISRYGAFQPAFPDHLQLDLQGIGIRLIVIVGSLAHLVH